MPQHRHTRVALSAAALVAAAGILVPAQHVAPPQPIGLVASTLRVAAQGSVAASPTARPHAHASPTPAAQAHQVRTVRPTPPPPAPAPPPAGGLRVVTDPVSFRDDSGAHSGAPALQDATGILVDVDSRTILWENRPHQSMPPASTAKVVSSMVALTNFAPTKTVTITPEALGQASDETVMGIGAGETYTVEELLSGMLTVSANDAATAMAVDTVGMDDFVAAMNAQIQALGLHDSHFTTSVGLDDPQQYASAYDLAAVAMEDMARYPVFGNIVWRQSVNLPQTATHPKFYLPNLNRLLEFYPAAIGVKPGYTGNAGPCLVGEAVRGGHHLIAVVMNDPVLYTDEVQLFDWGFEQYGLPPLG